MLIKFHRHFFFPVLLSLCIVWGFSSCKQSPRAKDFSATIEDFPYPNRQSVFWQADSLKYRRMYPAAISRFESVLEKGLPAHADSVYCFNQLIYLALTMNRDTQARTWLNELERYVPMAPQETIGNRADFAFNKGLSAYHFFEKDTALRYLRLADSLYFELYAGRPHIRRALCKTELGFCLAEFAVDIPKAIRYAKEAYEMFQADQTLQDYALRCELLMASVQVWSRGFETAFLHLENCINLTRDAPWVDTISLAQAWVLKGRILFREAGQTSLDSITQKDILENSRQAFHTTALLITPVHQIRKLQLERYLALFYLTNLYETTGKLFGYQKINSSELSHYKYQFSPLKPGESGGRKLMDFCLKHTDPNDRIALDYVHSISRQIQGLDHLQMDVHHIMPHPQYFYSDQWLNGYSAFLVSNYEESCTFFNNFLNEWEAGHEIYLDLENSFRDKTYDILSICYEFKSKPDYHAAILWTGKMINDRISPAIYNKWPVENLLKPAFYKDYPYSQRPFNAIGALLIKAFDAGKKKNINYLRQALSVFKVADSLFVQSVAGLDDNAVRYYEFDTSDELYSNALNTVWQLKELDPAHRAEYVSLGWFFTERMKAFILFRDHPSQHGSDSIYLLKHRIDSTMSKIYRAEPVAVSESRLATKSIYDLEKMRLYRPANAAVPSLDRVQDKLAANEAVVSFYWGKEYIHRIVVTREQTLFCKPVPVKRLDSNVEELRSYFQNIDSNFNNVIKPSNQIYAALLQDIEAEIGQKTSWILIPSGKLFFIPFESLMTESAFNGLENAPFLIKRPDLSIVYTASWRMFEQKRSDNAIENKTRQQVWFFGSEQVDSWLQERTAIQRSVPTSMFQDFSSSDCSRKKFIDAWESDEPCSVLHLCVHGTNNPGRLSNSKIWFGSGAGDTLYDYQLSGYRRRDLSLVVLSSCQSAFGQSQYSEGVYSIARCFIQGGAHAVLASMWNLTSAINPPIMDVFYEKFTDFNCLSQSLGTAKRAFLDTHTDCLEPKYWATMILIE
jgi:CHAT domain-containing protein